MRAHPEVVVVTTFDELKKYNNQKIALWIDKNATPFDSQQAEWINATPQAYYPLILIGTSDTLYAFRDLLQVNGFQGSAGTYPGFDKPGFSVIQRERPANMDSSDVLFIHGYDQRPTIQSILEITNELLDGKIIPTPISTLPQPANEIPTSAIHQVILDSQELRDQIPHDAAKINTLSIGGNILTLDVAYHGSCKEHTFALYGWTAFLQSNPPQVVLMLSHDAHGDTCTDDVEQEISFDMTALDRERNDPSEHPVLLRITEPTGSSFASEPVMPLLEWP